MTAPAVADPAATCDPATGECELEKSSKLSVQGWNSIVFFGRHASLTGTLSQSDGLCVAAKDGLYTVTLSSAQGAARFAMSAGSWSTMPYHVSFSAGGAQAADMAPGVPYLFPTERRKCDGSSDNAQIRLEVRAADFNGATSGLYADILTAVFSVP